MTEPKYEIQWNEISTPYASIPDYIITFAFLWNKEIST